MVGTTSSATAHAPVPSAPVPTSPAATRPEPFALVPAAYLLLLRPTPPVPAERVEAGSVDAPASPCPLPTPLSGLPGSRGTQVLLQLRQNTGYMDGYWACGVAGHVDPGESVLATAIREAHEEVGIDVEPADLIPLTAMHRSNEPGGAALEQRVDFFLAARNWRGEPGVAEPERNAGLRWFTLDRLPDKVPPHERAVLAAVATWLDGGCPVPPVVTFGFQGETIDRYGVARPHGRAHSDGKSVKDCNASSIPST